MIIALWIAIAILLAFAALVVAWGIETSRLVMGLNERVKMLELFGAIDQSDDEGYSMTGNTIHMTDIVDAMSDDGAVPQ